MATADGSILIRTKVDNSGIKQGTASIQNGIKGLSSSLLKLGATMGLVFGVAQLIQFGKQAVKTASEMTNAYIGLKSIVEGTGNSFEQANAFIQSYISDGLVPATEAVTAYKNLLMRGYSTDQIESVMTALKDSASFGRQASLTLGGAVATATEGLKNENSILVDNAGVTKNVSVMWKEYADSIGVGVNSLTKQQKIQAEVNGIMTETRFQTGDAAKVAATWSGQISQLNVKWQQFMAIIGNGIITALTPFVKALNNILTVAIEVGNAMASVFGWQSLTDQTSTSIASNTADTATSADNITDSTNATNKALKKQVSFFEDINVLTEKTSTSTSSGTGTTTTTGAGSSIGANVADVAIPKFTESVKKFIESIKSAWKTGDFTFIGSYIGEKINDFFEKTDFKQVFGTLSKVVIGLETALTGAINAINWKSLGQKIADGLDSVDWEKLLKTTGELISSAIGGGIDILAGIKASSEKSKLDDTWLQKQLPSTLWDWIVLGGATIGIDFSFIVKDKKPIDDLETQLSRMKNDASGAYVASQDTYSFSEGIQIGFQKILDSYDEFNKGFHDKMEKFWTDFGLSISNWWDKSVAPWFSKDTWNQIGTDMGNGLKNGINGALAGVINFLNSVIGGFETFLNGVIIGTNAMIETMNKLPGVKLSTGKTISLDRVPIPKLAQGAVIPANSEFMAILGDQKSGTNIEAPLETIKQAVREVLGNGTSGNGQTLVFQVDGQAFARITLPSTLNEMNRQGYDVAVLGV